MSSIPVNVSDRTEVEIATARGRKHRSRVPQALTFWAVAVVVLAPVYAYIGLRLVTESELPRVAAAAAWLALAVHAVLVPGSFVASRLTQPSRTLDGLYWVTYVGMGFLALVLPLLGVRDLAGFAWRVLSDAPAHASFVAPSADAFPGRVLWLTRLGNLGIVVVSLTATGFGLVAARRLAAVKHVRVPIDGLPEALDGYRIVQISDIHVGPTIKADYVRAIVDAVNALDPHLVVLTGDLVDGSVEGLREHTQVLAELRARDGRFYVTGNHEYYSGPDAWVREIARLGLTPLMNENRVLEVGGALVLVAGVTDAMAGRMVPGHRANAEAALAGAAQADLAIFLSHQPNTARHAARLGAHLQISGHTHGGQFFPWHLPVRLVTPYVAGLFRIPRPVEAALDGAGGLNSPPQDTGSPRSDSTSPRASGEPRAQRVPRGWGPVEAALDGAGGVKIPPQEAMWLDVSRGTGDWGPPLRLGAPSEITVLEIVRA